MMELTEYVILPGADYKAACDALREKSGKSAGIQSGELAWEIRSLPDRVSVNLVDTILCIK